MIINIIRIILPLFFLLLIESILVYLLIQININNELNILSKLSVSFFIFLASFVTGFIILQNILNEYFIIKNNKKNKYDKNIKNKKIIHLSLLHDRNSECPICLEKIDYEIFPYNEEINDFLSNIEYKNFFKCNHLLHINCYMNYLKSVSKNIICPICRSEMIIEIKIS